LSLRKATWKMF